MYMYIVQLKMCTCTAVETNVNRLFQEIRQIDSYMYNVRAIQMHVHDRVVATRRQDSMSPARANAVLSKPFVGSY